MPGPEAVAHAADVLRQLDAQHPGWVEAIVLSQGLRQAGERMGRSEASASIMCARLTADALRLADTARREPKREPIRKARPVRRRAQKSMRAECRAAECLRLAENEAIGAADQYMLLLLADCGGLYKRAAAAIQMDPCTMRAVVMRARRAVGIGVGIKGKAARKCLSAGAVGSPPSPPEQPQATAGTP
jgi:hypothetical protein